MYLRLGEAVSQQRREWTMLRIGKPAVAPRTVRRRVGSTVASSRRCLSVEERSLRGVRTTWCGADAGSAGSCPNSRGGLRPISSPWTRRVGLGTVAGLPLEAGFHLAGHDLAGVLYGGYGLVGWCPPRTRVRSAGRSSLDGIVCG